jgi:hypothetical protein
MKILEFCYKFFNTILKISRTSVEAEKGVIMGGGGEYRYKDAKLVITNQHI